MQKDASFFNLFVCPQDLSEEKSEWDHTLDKIKLLNKLATDGPIPLEIFNSEVRLVKQGPLTQVVGKKETPRHCILFNNYISLALSKDNQYRIIEVCFCLVGFFFLGGGGGLLGRGKPFLVFRRSRWYFRGKWQGFRFLD